MGRSKAILLGVNMPGFVIASIVLGVVLYFVVPDVPFLAALFFGPVILVVSMGMRKLLGLDKER